MMNDQSFAELVCALELPVAVTEILESHDPSQDMEAHTIYALHELISEMQPDTALLAMAVSTLIILNKNGISKEPATMTMLECERLVHDYGALWLKNAQDENVDISEVEALLDFICEDLDAMRLMFSQLAMQFSQGHAVAGEIFEIFAAQAGAQGLVAEALLDIGQDDCEFLSESLISDDLPGFNEFRESAEIIPFPGQSVH